MPDYANGKIYKIVCNTTGLVYVGSTCELRLARRLVGHRSDFTGFNNGSKHKHYRTSFEVMKQNNYEIILIELFNCETKDELTARERYYIETTECVNKIVPTRTRQERDETNKDAISVRRKAYRENNIDREREIGKIYRDKNKEEINRINRENYPAKKEKENARNKIYREKKKIQKLIIPDIID
jgi:hypothetical protein